MYINVVGNVRVGVLDDVACSIADNDLEIRGTVWIMGYPST